MGELLAAMEDLRVSALTLRRRYQVEAGQAIPALGRLTDAIQALGQDRPARYLVCPEEYVRDWQNRTGGKQVRLDPRAIRFLYWEPTVVLDPEFHYHLEEHQHRVGARGLQGLIRACHVRWSDYLKNESIKRIAKRRLRGYKGPNRIVNRWQANEEKVLGSSGPQIMALEMLRDSMHPHEVATAWAIDEGSSFFKEVVHCTLSLARVEWGSNRALPSYACRVLLNWDRWAPHELKEHIANCIMDHAASSDEIRGPLKAFIFGDPRFGDPRRTENRTNWIGVPPEATRRLVEWLSRDDIVFFFDHAFPRGGDPHRRKPFWLRYLPCVLMSRPLLNQEDLARLRPLLRQLGAKVGNFGHVNGNSSAFLLDFGEVCAIEFNRVGACYVYPQRVIQQVVPDFWSAGYFRESGLKRKDLLGDPHQQRIIHRPGWQDDLQQLLARYGVRPTSG